MAALERNLLLSFFEALLDCFGPQHWWPGESPFEVMVGAILTQNTNWKNVEKVINRLRKNDLMQPHALSAVEGDLMRSMLRPVGYYRLKARRLLNFLDFFRDRFAFDIGRMKGIETAPLREQLLGINGIGPETADSILLYALNRPIFVVDAYTRRVLARHRVIEKNSTYTVIQQVFMNNLPPDTALFNEYHALLVRVGKESCRTIPRCSGCPLEPFLKEPAAV